MIASTPQTRNTRIAEPQPPIWETHKSWLAPRLVVITFLTLIFGLIGERQNYPDWLMLILGMTAYVAGGFYGTLGAVVKLREHRLDIDLLMILAAIGAALVGEWQDGAMLLFLFSLSNVLQDYAIGRSRKAISGLMKLYPSEAKVRRGDAVETVAVSEIRPGDLILIQPGERIPVDGVVRGGQSSIDQSPITGESIPVEKSVGDKVFAGTLNQQGALDIEATQAATDTVLARIIKMVEEAQDSKAPTERFLDRFEQIYAFIILASVGLLIFIPPALGLIDFQSNFYRAMVLMTVASPCALVISTPAAFLSAIAAAARRGVLFKGGAYLENLAMIKGVAFDKTGTLTKGKPAVTDVIPAAPYQDSDLLIYAASIEARSEHPLGQAIVREAETRGIVLADVSAFEALPGKGVTGCVDEAQITAGSPASFAGEALPPEFDAIHALQGQGKTVILARRNDTWLGLIAIADQIRPEAAHMVHDLREMDVRAAMLTGDNALTATYIASQLGIAEVEANLLPADKVSAITRLQRDIGAMAMVGDGVNDAPALANADIGIAMGAAGSDVALETADVVLMGDKLELIPYAIRTSRKARRVVWQNLTFAIGVVVVLIIATFAVDLPLPVGVLGHEGSTVIVVLNGLIQLLLIPEWQRSRETKMNSVV
jgi:Cd2+/Zn2+-exporting ATPase